MEHWGLLLFPWEDTRGSKTAEYDESVVLDSKEFDQLGPQLQQLKKRAGERGKLWTFSYTQYLEKFKRYAELAGLQKMNVHPYMVRHGGASRDSLLGLRSLLQIKQRGRWRSDTNVRRYEKHTRIIAETARIPSASRKFGIQVEKHLVELLNGRLRALPPPGQQLQRAGLGGSAATPGKRALSR